MCFQKYPGSVTTIYKTLIQNIYIHISIYINLKSRGAIGKIKLKIVDQDSGILDALKYIYPGPENVTV